MLGPTATTTIPEVAPDGIVATMLVSLQLLTGNGVPFNVTRLPVAVVPKCEPEIVSWVPMSPVVGTSEVITGAGAAALSTDT